MKVYIVQYIPEVWSMVGSRVVGVYKDERVATHVCEALESAHKRDSTVRQYYMDDYEVIE